MRFSIQEAVGDESSQYMASASATNAIHTTVGDDSWYYSMAVLAYALHPTLHHRLCTKQRIK